MRIQNNVPALNAHRFYTINNNGMTKSIAKLSSGYRINSAADDAAGLAISEKMRAQIRGLTMASKNAQDATSLVQTAEGGMQEIDNMLQRIRELVDYAANDTQEHNASMTGDRQKIQDEINQLTQEIDAMADRVEFNKKKLLNGEIAGQAQGEAKLNANLAAAKTNLKGSQAVYSEALQSFKNATSGAQTARDAFYSAFTDVNINSYVDTIATNGSEKIATQLDNVNKAISDLRTAMNASDDLPSVQSLDAKVTAIEDAMKALGEGLDAVKTTDGAKNIGLAKTAFENLANILGKTKNASSTLRAAYGGVQATGGSTVSSVSALNDVAKGITDALANIFGVNSTTGKPDVTKLTEQLNEAIKVIKDYSSSATLPTGLTDTIPFLNGLASTTASTAAITALGTALDNLNNALTAPGLTEETLSSLTTQINDVTTAIGDATAGVQQFMATAQTNYEKALTEIGDAISSAPVGANKVALEKLRDDITASFNTIKGALGDGTGYGGPLDALKTNLGNSLNDLTNISKTIYQAEVDRVNTAKTIAKEWNDALRDAADTVLTKNRTDAFKAKYGLGDLSNTEVGSKFTSQTDEWYLDGATTVSSGNDAGKVNTVAGQVNANGWDSVQATDATYVLLDGTYSGGNAKTISLADLKTAVALTANKQLFDDTDDGTSAPGTTNLTIGGVTKSVAGWRTFLGITATTGGDETSWVAMPAGAAASGSLVDSKGRTAGTALDADELTHLGTADGSPPTSVAGGLVVNSTTGGAKYQNETFVTVSDMKRFVPAALTGGKGLVGAYTTYNEKNSELTVALGKMNDDKSKLALAQQELNSAPKTGGLYFQVGANANQGMQLYINSVKSDFLGIGDGNGISTISVLDKSGANITAQLDTLDTALSYVTTERAKLGAAQNRMEYTMSSLDISAENLTAAESRIRDVDMAKEMSNFTRQNILFQASTAMLAQANSMPQGVLQLLG